MFIQFNIKNRQPQNVESANGIQNLKLEKGIKNGIQNQTGLFLKGKDKKNTKFRLYFNFLCVVCFELSPLCLTISILEG